MFDLRQKFMNETADLRRAMTMKSCELAELWRAQTPDEQQIRGKQQELNALRDQMQARRVSFQTQVRKIAPQAGVGRGFGRGCGPGYSMGPKGGMGPGGNW